MADHVGAHWVKFDVAIHRQQIGGRIHPCRRVPPFPPCAAAPIEEVEVLDVLAAPRLQGSSKNPSFPRRRESSVVIFLGSRFRENDESGAFRGALQHPANAALVVRCQVSGVRCQVSGASEQGWSSARKRGRRPGA